MPAKLNEMQDGKVIHVVLSGKLTKEDYLTFMPEFEKQIARHGKIRMLVELDDFHGWEMAAAWEDFKFDRRHFHDIERLAMVGDSVMLKGMALFCKPFTAATVKSYHCAQIDDAKDWVQE